MAKRTAAALIALSLLGGCHPARIGQGRNMSDHAVTVANRLVCPARSGDLILAEAAADGRRCRYAADDGRKVELGYLALASTDAAVALQRVEGDLRTRLGVATPAIGPAPRPDADDDKRDDGDADVKTTGRGNGDGGNVSINLPGLHIDAKDGDAHIRAFGETIDADKRGGAVVSGRWNGAANEIHANDDGVEMRFGFAGRQAVDMTFILTSSRPGASGLKLVGYVARGPTAGPLVLATVTATNGRTHGDHTDLKDVNTLVGDNVTP